MDRRVGDCIEVCNVELIGLLTATVWVTCRTAPRLRCAPLTTPACRTHRKDTCAAVAAETGFFTVHPYDDYNTMAGQGTIGLELLQQVTDSPTQ